LAPRRGGRYAASLFFCRRADHLLAVGLYLHTAYQRYESYAKNEAANLVESAEMLLDQQIKGSSAEPCKPRLAGLPGAQAHPDALPRQKRAIRFAYLLYEQDGKYYLFMDSEPGILRTIPPTAGIYRSPRKR
jgi:hypothetical protein